jgi:hypothetical protein
MYEISTGSSDQRRQHGFAAILTIYSEYMAIHKTTLKTMLNIFCQYKPTAIFKNDAI